MTLSKKVILLGLLIFKSTDGCFNPELIQKFSEIDKNLNGELDVNEFCPHENQACIGLWITFDLNEDGVVECQEFLLDFIRETLSSIWPISSTLRSIFAEKSRERCHMQPDEIAEFMKQIDPNLSDENLEDALDKLDLDRNGLVSCEEFIMSLFEEAKIQKQKAQGNPVLNVCQGENLEQFLKMDLDQNGFLSRLEIAQVIGEDQAEQAMPSLDLNGDEQVSCQESVAASLASSFHSDLEAQIRKIFVKAEKQGVLSQSDLEPLLIANFGQEQMNENNLKLAYDEIDINRDAVVTPKGILIKYIFYEL